MNYFVNVSYESIKSVLGQLASQPTSLVKKIDSYLLLSVRNNIMTFNRITSYC
jgi:hypothetical protein